MTARPRLTMSSESSALGECHKFFSSLLQCFTCFPTLDFWGSVAAVLGPPYGVRGWSSFRCLRPAVGSAYKPTIVKHIICLPLRVRRDVVPAVNADPSATPLRPLPPGLCRSSLLIAHCTCLHFGCFRRPPLCCGSASMPGGHAANEGFQVPN